MKISLSLLAVAAASLLAVAGCSGSPDAAPNDETGNDEINKTKLSLSCINTPSRNLNEWSIGLEAKIASSTELRNVKLTTFERGASPETEVGTSDKELANPNYRPVKYKNSNQFNLGLKGADGHDFLPLDYCEFQAILPDNLATLKAGAKFQARMIYHCDQNGGSTAYDCSVK